MAKARAKYYAVAVGRKPGVYTSWPECESQVKGFSGHKFMGFPSHKEAQKFILETQKYILRNEQRVEEATHLAEPRGNSTPVHVPVMEGEDDDKNKATTPAAATPHVVAATAAAAAVASGAPDTHKGKYYAVAVGRVPGIYYDWNTCQKQTNQYPNARHKSFETHAGAVAYVKENGNHFAMVPDFRPDNSAPFDDEFNRYASSQGIEEGSLAYQSQRTEAIKREFDVLFLSQPTVAEEGEETDEDDDSGMEIKGERQLTPVPRDELILRALRELCLLVGLVPRATAHECGMAIKDVGPINIVDFLDAKRYGKSVEIWPWRLFGQFKHYTLNDKTKCVVLRIAKEHPLLRALLQPLTSKASAKHARRKASLQSPTQMRRLVEMRPDLRHELTLLDEANKNTAKPTVSPLGSSEQILERLRERLRILAQIARDDSTPSSALSAAPVARAVDPIKEEEDDENEQQQRPPVERAGTPPRPSTFPAIACAQLPSMPPSQSPKKQRQASAPATSARRSARIAAKEDDTDDVRMIDVPAATTVPATVTQQPKRKYMNVCFVEIPSRDDDGSCNGKPNKRMRLCIAP
ncbi:hypothetical protein PGQ11_002244 [Apiospora arundinis]|uniref:Ribonuclease H1 N-terminal domain-containing protein n=1 Tax=Apiospora arundinis TaxID=335852 RepID=A0ABR2JIG7_9PEZI